MQRILIVLLMLTAGMAHARILHVGDNTIKLSQTKTTTLALHVCASAVWVENRRLYCARKRYVGYC